MKQMKPVKAWAVVGLNGTVAHNKPTAGDYGRLVIYTARESAQECAFEDERVVRVEIRPVEKA